LIDFWLLISSHWVRDSLEPFIIRSCFKSLLEILELSGVIKSLGSIWVEVTQVVEVLLSKSLALSVTQLRLVKRVMDELLKAESDWETL
jgi:hypothetical protein